MRQIIFTLITATLFILNLKAEDTLIAKLIGLEKAFYSSNSSAEKTAIAYQKFNFLIFNNILNEQCVLEIDRIDAHHLTITEQKNFFWNSTIISFVNNINSKAIYFFERYQESNLDSSNEALLLSSLIHSDYNSEKSKKSLLELSKRDTVFNCLICLSRDNSLNEKNKKVKIVSSAIIPGLGMMLNGNILKGLTSTALKTSSIILINHLILNKSYINALGWGFSLWLKFYTGNLKLTEKLIDEKQNNIYRKKSEQCKNNWIRILNFYPLKFKH
jgi:hypothetical protein